MSTNTSSVPVWHQRIIIYPPDQCRDFWRVAKKGWQQYYPIACGDTPPKLEKARKMIDRAFSRGGFYQWLINQERKRLSARRVLRRIIPTIHELARCDHDVRLGLREWEWSTDDHVLISPYRRTPWHDSVMEAEGWSDAHAVEGEAGIHAYRLSVESFREGFVRMMMQSAVPGIVERLPGYGAVIGEKGWRAEAVAIRMLWVTASIADDVRAAYPDVEVIQV